MEMHHKSWFTFSFGHNRGDEISVHFSLFKMMPFNCISCLLFGVPLSKSTKLGHILLFLLSGILRFLISYTILRHDIKKDATLATVNQVAIYILGFPSFWLFMRRKKQIVRFLSSDPSLAPKLHKIDLLCPLMYSVIATLQMLPFILTPSIISFYENTVMPASLDFCPPLKHTLFASLLVLSISWFHLAPFSVGLYALGYCVLYSSKLTLLNSISEKKTNYQDVLIQVKSVYTKHEHFESSFGPLLFICFCCYFISTVNMIYIFKILYTNQLTFYYYFLAYSLLVQFMSAGLVLFVSIYNEKLKRMSILLLGQLELQLGETSLGTLMISYLQKRIWQVTNEPLTAWKMVTVSRQVILTVTASCITFSVLFIQIISGTV